MSGNDAVLVTGLGPVGLAAAMLAARMGAEHVIGIDVDRERLELARTLGLCRRGARGGRRTTSQQSGT